MKRTIILLLALLILLLSSVCFLTGCGLPSLESIIAMGSDAQAAAIITASNLVMSDETLSCRADTKTHATLIMSNIFTEVDMETYEVSVAPNAETGEGFCGYVRRDARAHRLYDTGGCEYLWSSDCLGTGTERHAVW